VATFFVVVRRTGPQWDSALFMKAVRLGRSWLVGVTLASGVTRVAHSSVQLTHLNRLSGSEGRVGGALLTLPCWCPLAAPPQVALGERSSTDSGRTHTS